MPSFSRKNPSGVRLPAFDEGPIALIDVRRDQPRGLRIGARHHQRRHAHHIGGKPRRDEIAHMCRGRDQHLAAEVAALLFGRELIFEMHAGSARLDEGLHDLKTVERSAEARFRVGDDRREPVTRGATFRMLDLIGSAAARD